jgi:hypothetical protein
VKRPKKSIQLVQLHLPLLTASKADIADDKQKELAAALIELLVSATQESQKTAINGGSDELEAHR